MTGFQPAWDGYVADGGAAVYLFYQDTSDRDRMSPAGLVEEWENNQWLASRVTGGETRFFPDSELKGALLWAGGGVDAPLPELTRSELPREGTPAFPDRRLSNGRPPRPPGY